MKRTLIRSWGLAGLGLLALLLTGATPAEAPVNLARLMEATDRGADKVARAVAANRSETHIVGSLHDGITHVTRKGDQWNTYLGSRTRRY